MESSNQTGFGAVLANRGFRSLWMAQLLAQTSQHAIHFIQMVLIERLTGSATQLALVILAFSLPGVIFSPVAGVVVDRFPRKWVLVGSNLSRVFFGAGYIAVLAFLQGPAEILAIYILSFLTSSVAQFFGPAEAASIPFLVGEKGLLAANSLFNLTMALAQIAGLMVLGPLAVNLLQAEGGFVIVTLMYLGAALLVLSLPGEKRHTMPARSGPSRWRLAWQEATEGWHFVSSSPVLRATMLQLVTITTLVMVMAMLAPGYAARVLGMNAQDAVILFAPAGAGMLLATGIVGRWGHLLRRVDAGHIGLVLVGLGFAALGLISQDYQRLMQPILRVYPGAALSLATSTMVLAFALGLCLSGVNILALTALQQGTPAHLRGRVFSVQFMLCNLVGIPPMLILGQLADSIGIPRVLGIIGAGAVLLAVFSTAQAWFRPLWQAARRLI